MKKFCAVVAFFLSLSFDANNKTSAITFSGGERLGDKLRSYIKAHYCSYITKLPFIGRRFPFSDQFMFHELEQYYDQVDTKSFSDMRIFPMHELTSLKVPAKPILFSVVFTKDIGDFIDSIHDRIFIEQMKKLLMPRFSQRPLNLPSDRISVAVHVRKGGGYDVPPAADGQNIDPNFKAQGVSNRRNLPSDKVWPLKFPPDSYYTSQIRKLSEILHDCPLYIFIFTDDPHPDTIAQKFRREVAKQNITYAFREGIQDYEENVIEDFFAMTHFDCIIRPDSAFSQIAEFIGDHALAIKPTRALWKKENLVVDRVTIKINYPAASRFKLHQEKMNNDRCYTFEVLQ